MLSICFGQVKGRAPLSVPTEGGGRDLVPAEVLHREEEEDTPFEWKVSCGLSWQLPGETVPHCGSSIWLTDRVSSMLIDVRLQLLGE